MKKSVHPKLSEQAHKILKERAKVEHRYLQNFCEVILEKEAEKIEREMKNKK